jgi:hypothetical protein
MPLADIFFDYDQWALRDEARAVQRNADWLRRWSSTRMRIEGHGDSRGTSEYNLALGQRRVETVKTYLVSLVITPDRLLVVSKGEEAPFCRAESEACSQQNRRALRHHREIADGRRWRASSLGGWHVVSLTGSAFNLALHFRAGGVAIVVRSRRPKRHRVGKTPTASRVRCLQRWARLRPADHPDADREAIERAAERTECAGLFPTIAATVKQCGETDLAEPGERAD